MEDSIFITGYPGFLAQNLVEQIIKDHGQTIQNIYLLVLPKEMEKAQIELNHFTSRTATDRNIFTIFPGDITKTGLGMIEETAKEIENSVTHLFHLAAIYDLAVPESLAYEVNVHGTKLVTEWARKMTRLKRYVYFSTAYVSGTREGRIYETELQMGQSFKNHYERTKYEAEIIVEKAKVDLPTTIIRPGIVRGHSQTGETTKFDGIYFMLNLFDRLALSPVLPYLGDGHVEGNFVPVDYVLKASSYLAFQKVGIGKTYHLTDPEPYSMRQLYQMLAESYLGREPKGQISLELASLPLNFSNIKKWLKVEKEALAYFKIDSSYDCTQAVTDLKDADIVCPDFKVSIYSMIDFYRKYKHDYNKHIL